MQNLSTALLLFALATPYANAQQSAPPADPPSCAASAAASTFDVATVKPSQLTRGSSSVGGTADTLQASGTVQRLIEYAFDMREFQVLGAPQWATSTTWDVVAKLDQPVADWKKLSNDARSQHQRQRLRALLTQRFALKCHLEVRELPIYNLVVSKSGIRFKEAAPADPRKGLSWNGDSRGNHLDAGGVPITMLVTDLSMIASRTVVDHSGLSGVYNFTLNWSSDNLSAAQTDVPTGPSIFTALEEQLGLKLEPAKGPVPVVLIDSVEQPTDN